MPALWAVALILLVSAASKLFSPGSSQAAFDSLRVPQVLNRPWLAKAFPVLPHPPRRRRPPAPAPVLAVESEDGDDDVPRHRIPSTPVVRRGTFYDLPVLAASQAMLVFRISPGCGSCGGVLERVRGRGPAFGPVAVAGPDEVLQMADEVRDLFGEEPAPAPTPSDAPLTLLDHSTTAEGPSA